MDISDKQAEGLSKWGGRREGAGRPTGTRNFNVTMREQMIAEIRGRTFEHTNNLYLAQLTLALGYKTLWKIEKELVVGPKGGHKYIAKRPVAVTATHEVEEYLTKLVDEFNGEEIEDEPDATYFFIVNVPPNNGAIESLLERTLGKIAEMKGPDGPGGDAQAPEEMKLLAEKLNEIHSGTGVRGNGAASDTVGAQAQN